MPKLVSYLLTKKKINYVLPGDVSSDPIKGRFGRYRRSAGTNYFISVYQILEAEKAVRIQSLVSLDGLNLTEIQEIFPQVLNRG